MSMIRWNMRPVAGRVVVSMSMIRWNMRPVAGRVEQQDGLAWGTRNEFRKNGNELSGY